MPPLPADLPRFPARIPDRGDLDWRNRHLGDGYDYDQAATAGAATTRAALEFARAKRGDSGPRRPAPVSLPTPTPFVPPERLGKALRATPDPPPIPTPGRWADGTPIFDDDIPEEDR